MVLCRGYMGKSDRKKKTRKTNCFIRSLSFVLLKTEHSQAV